LSCLLSPPAPPPPHPLPTRRSSDLNPPAAHPPPPAGTAALRRHPRRRVLLRPGAASAALARGAHDVTEGEDVATTQTGTDRWKADRKSTRLNSSHRTISYAGFCLKK